MAGNTCDTDTYLGNRRLASLNLFENPLIINGQGNPFSTNPKSPFRLAKKVYNLYDLLNLEHADNERTKYSSFCKPTSIKTPLQLHNENNKVPVAQWEIILAAIPAHIKQTLLKGPAPPSEKEVFACSRFNVDTEATQLGVIWQQQRGQNRTFMSSTYDANRLPTQLDGNPFPLVLPQSELLMFTLTMLTLTTTKTSSWDSHSLYQTRPFPLLSPALISNHTLIHHSLTSSRFAGNIAFQHCPPSQH